MEISLPSIFVVWMNVIEKREKKKSEEENSFWIGRVFNW